ncbi:MAG: 1-acyl-sn-glycerol-3-phosphate acyltransferase [Mesorhizobium sp.]
MASTQTGLLSARIELMRKGGNHIVDQLIAERTTRISRHPLWPLLRPMLVKFLHYDEAVAMADGIARLNAWDAFERVSELLSLDVTVENDHHLPKAGGFILTLNHPTGIADGIAVFDMLRERRPDMKFFANRDALRVSPGFRDMVIPVEWRAGQKSHGKSRDTLEEMSRAFSEDRPIVLFPSGRLAFWHEGRLTERPWQSSVVSLARRFNYPVVPAHIDARNSGFFYLVSRFSSEIRDMTLFHELLNKKRKQFTISMGPAISPDRLAGDPAAVAGALQDHIAVRMKDDPQAWFEGLESGENHVHARKVVA